MAPFSQAGLHPDQLEREKALVEKSIESVKEALRAIDIKVIHSLFREMYRRVVGPTVTEEELRSLFFLELDNHPFSFGILCS